MNTKTVTTVFFVVLLLFSISVPVSALSVYDIPIIKEIDLPEDLDFSIHDSCSGHAYFQQATADEAGNFAVFSLHYDVENLANTDFSKAYIDIYRSDGSFLQEVSFHTTFGFVVQLEGDVMRIYFYKSVLIYNISTQELHHYEIPASH